MTYHLKFRFIRRWASAAFAGIALVAQSAHADQGADLAIRLLQGVLGAAQQAGAQQTPPARSGGTMPVQLRSQPVYPSKEAWLVAVRQDIALPNAAQTRDYKRLAANVWLVLNTPEPVAGWPRDNVDWFGFEERVARGLRNTDQALALLLSDSPPTFMASSAEQVKREIGAVFQEIGNPAEMSGCRAGGQSCSDKLLAFFQEYVDAGLQGVQAERQRRIAGWQRQEQARVQAEQQKQALVDVAEQERKAAEAERIRIEAERVRAEEERRARQRASRVGG